MSGLELDPWWLISSLREWENERELFDEYAQLGSGLEDQDKLALLDGAENKALQYLDDLLRWRPSNGSVNHPSSGTLGSGSAVHCRGLCSSPSAATRSGWSFDQLPLRLIWFPARGITDTRNTTRIYGAAVAVTSSYPSILVTNWTSRESCVHSTLAEKVQIYPPHIVLAQTKSRSQTIPRPSACSVNEWRMPDCFLW